MRRLSSVLLALLVGGGLGLWSSATSARAAGPAGGVVLDGYGGVHPFGGASLNSSGAPYWPGWDIARSLAMKPDGGGGWELDGFGGVHAFGNARPVAYPYWPYWDIARSLSMLPDGRGYELDGFGGVHPLGGAPPLSGFPYWPNWDIARGLDIHVDRSGTPDGGWELDGFGQIHAFGNAPSLATSHYYPGFDVFRQLHVAVWGAYELARNGIVEQTGQPAGINWAGYPSWGAWDIERDVVPMNPSLPSNPGPTPDRAQYGAVMDLLHSVDRNQRGLTSLAHAESLAAVAGNGATFNTAACGGNAGTILDRSQDMYFRNYFAHPILGCAQTQYVFSTYERGWWYHASGENIGWLGGYSDPLDIVWRINSMWLASPEHYAIMMDPRFTTIGCGTFTLGGTYQGYRGPISVWACEFLG
ncbi:MAG: CAP domain-containing protein [Candidatus Dormibacteria bacterium]